MRTIKSASYSPEKPFWPGQRVAGPRVNFKTVAPVQRRCSLTDNIQPVSGIDFNNLTAMVNEPRTFGVEVGVKF